jgi:hypothetical protein
MDFNATIDLIIKDLDEARKIIDDLKKIPGVPVLQVELAKSKCKSAGEIIALLKEMSINESASHDQSGQKITPEAEPLKSELITIQDTTVIRHPSEEKRSTSKPSRATSETTVQKQEKVSEITIVRSVSESVEVKKDQKTETAKETDTSILADRFSHLSNRFNEHLGSNKSDEDITEKLNTKPISSLSDAIGINDKFHFIREIFNNDRDAFTQAITRLESTDSLADAKAIIMSYTGNSDENEAVSQLISLVKRKLQSDE